MVPINEDQLIAGTNVQRLSILSVNYSRLNKITGIRYI